MRIERVLRPQAERAAALLRWLVTDTFDTPRAQTA